jgi:hypothetical protein
MTFTSERRQPAVRLPSVLAIGFTGHRSLGDEDQSRRAIRGVLEDWKARFPGTVYGVSSAAAGGDLVFAETCLELGLAIRILLPLPREEFRTDFDAANWERAEKVFAQALLVEVVGSGERSPERYYECGIETVQRSQVLVALWDGGPSQGLGGTADIAHFAREQGRPVVWVHSATDDVQLLNVAEHRQEAAILHDPEMEFLSALPDPPAAERAETPRDIAQNWLIKVDENANRLAPQFRRLASIPILCTAAAAVLSGRGTFPGSSSLWLAAGAVLGLMGSGLPYLLRLTHRQIVWTRVRTAAEICRSCLALWRTPALYDVVGPETVPELAGVLTSINFLKMSDRAARRTTLEEFKREYHENRVRHQLAYFSRHAQRAATQIKKYKIVTGAAVTLGALLNFWILLNAHGFSNSIEPRWTATLAMAATACFQIATVAMAMLFVNDSQRRRDRYRELHRMLGQWEKQLKLAQAWSITLRITSLVEKALLAELLEWRSFIRHRQVTKQQ